MCFWVCFAASSYLPILSSARYCYSLSKHVFPSTTISSEKYGESRNTLNFRSSIESCLSVSEPQQVFFTVQRLTVQNSALVKSRTCLGRLSHRAPVRKTSSFRFQERKYITKGTVTRYIIREAQASLIMHNRFVNKTKSTVTRKEHGTCATHDLNPFYKV